MDKKIVPKKCIEQSNLSLFGGGQSGLLPPLPPAVLFFRIFEVASTATGTTSLVIKKATKWCQLKFGYGEEK